MIYTLLGIKKNMTSAYDTRGRRVGATVVLVKPNFVTQIKVKDSRDGYEAVQIGMGEKKSVRKPQIGHFKKAGIDQKVQFIKEVRIKPMRTASKNKLSAEVQSTLDDISLGQTLNVGQVFFVGDSIKVSGTSKGKGFQGGVRRYNFQGGPKTHGQSDRHRAPGSIGSGTTPGRVYRGKKMAGHMGVESVSYSGVEVLAVDKANNLIVIKGGVPGPFGGLVILEKQGRVKGYTPPPEEKEDEEEEGAENQNNSENSEETQTTSENQGVGESDNSENTSGEPEVRGEEND